MNRNHKIFGWVLGLYFGVVFALGFSGKLDQWEAEGYLLPEEIILVGAVLILIFILLASFCEPFARWLEGGDS